MRDRWRILASCGAASMAAFASACSKNDADVTVNEVVVTDAPVARSSVWVDPSLKDGKAEWHPFRIPEDKPPVEAKSASKVAAGKSGGAGGLDADAAKQVEADIREMIKAYNDLVAEGKLDDAVEYWVEPQHAMAKKVNAAILAAKEALRQLRDELNQRAPEATDRVAKAFAALDEAVDLRLTVDSIKVKNETDAEEFDERNPTQPTMQFHRIEEDWYLEVPEVLAPLYEGAATKLAPAFAAMKAALQNGAPADPMLQQLEAMSSRMSGGAKPEGETGPDEP